MNWFDWVLVVLFALGALSTVTSVGRPRPPITPGVAGAIVLINGLLIAGVITLS